MPRLFDTLTDAEAAVLSGEADGSDDFLIGDCQWFARCENVAATRADHPAFPAGVPICEKHAAWLSNE